MTILRVSPQRMASGAPRFSSTGADLVGQRLARRVGDRLDLQPLVVEDDLLGVGLGLDVERRRAADALGVEIDVEVERDMGDARFQRLGVAVDVDRVGAGQDRRDLPALGGGGGAGSLGLAGQQATGPRRRQSGCTQRSNSPDMASGGFADGLVDAVDRPRRRPAGPSARRIRAERCRMPGRTRSGRKARRSARYPRNAHGRETLRACRGPCRGSGRNNSPGRCRGARHIQCSFSSTNGLRIAAAMSG